jgi:ribosomal protein S18 acetylase RimI-like enzyme
LAERGQGLEVAQVDPRRLHDLRRRMLRRGDPAANVDEPRDAEATSLHLAGLVAGQVVVCASFYANPYDGAPDRSAYQLRFMATDAAFQGRGFGSRVLAEAERRLAARGVELVWAHARDSALGFYRAEGWTVDVGTEFVKAETGIAHTVIHKRLAAPAT